MCCIECSLSEVFLWGGELVWASWEVCEFIPLLHMNKYFFYCCTAKIEDFVCMVNRTSPRSQHCKL